MIRGISIVAKPYNIQTEKDISSFGPYEFEQIRKYLTNLYFAGTDQISPDELKDIYARAEDLGISKDLVPLVIQKAYEAGGAKGYTIEDYNKLMQGMTLPELNASKQTTPVGASKNTVVGGTGIDFAGENTGLRQPYVPLVEDMLERFSGLIALRDKPDAYKDMYNYSTPEYEALQKSRKTAVTNLPTYTKPSYGFAAPATGGAAGGRVNPTGIMSLINTPQKYEVGGAVGNDKSAAAQNSSTVNPPVYTTPTFTAEGELGSTFNTPTTTYTAPTSISSGYTEPSNIYKAGTISSTYTKPTEYSPTNISSIYSSPSDIYKAGTVSSTFTKPQAYTGNTLSSAYTKPIDYTTSNFATELFGAEQADKYMSPYISGVVDPQIREAKRQAELARQTQGAKFTQAGAFGGARNAIAEAELGRNLATQIGDIYGKGQQEAFLNAQQQFERDQQRRIAAEQLKEQSKQFGFGQKTRAEEVAAQLGLEASKATEQSKQFGADIGLRGETTAAQLGLQAATATEQAKQAAGQQALADAQKKAELALEASKAAEQAKQFGYGQKTRAEEIAAQLGLQAATATEQAKQAAGQQALTSAETAGRLGLDASRLLEQSKQAAAQQALSTAVAESDAQARARDLQQRAQEAKARGDEFSANLLQRQFEEAAKGIESQRAYDYQVARDEYLDPFRELTALSGVLGSLPMKAGDTGISLIGDALSGGASSIALLKQALGIK